MVVGSECSDMARDWGLRVCGGGWSGVAVVAAGESLGFFDDQGSQEEEEGVGSGWLGGGEAGWCCCVWAVRWDGDWVSLANISMNMAISRSAEGASAAAGGVWVGLAAAVAGDA